MEKKGCAKRMLIGCGLFLSATLLLVGILVGSAVLNPVKPPDQKVGTLDDKLPVVAEQPDGLLGGAPKLSSKPVILHLNCEYTKVTVKRGDQLSGIRVVSNYDQSNFELKTNIEEGKDQIDYHLDFGNKRNLIAMALSGIKNDRVEFNNELTIYVPGDVPVGFDYELSKGEWVFDMTDLAVQSIVGDARMGAFEARMKTKNPIPMEKCAVNFSMGESTWIDYQNFNFKKASFEGSMGEIKLRSNDRLAQDTEIYASVSMGECWIDLPPETQVTNEITTAMADSVTREIKNSDPNWPTLHLKGSVTMASLFVRPPDAVTRQIEKLEDLVLEQKTEEIKAIMELVKSKGEDSRATTQLNELGYRFLWNDEVPEAIEVFKLNTTYFPNYANGFDSLGEAYFKANEYKLAQENYQKALEMDPDNENASRQLLRIQARLEGKPDPDPDLDSQAPEPPEPPSLDETGDPSDPGSTTPPAPETPEP